MRIGCEYCLLAFDDELDEEVDADDESVDVDEDKFNGRCCCCCIVVV